MTTPPPPHTVNVEEEGIHWDLRKSLSYGHYLDLEHLLACQHPLSGTHDELLFITVHQASEIWMKLQLHELSAAIALIRQDEVSPALKMLARVERVMRHLTHSWDVLSTLTPADYSRFRPFLGTGSGFQSFQYRMLEFLLGNKNAAMIEVHKHDEAVYGQLKAILEAPSLYDEVLQLLSRRGFALPSLGRNWSEPYAASPEVEAAWLTIYQDTERYWELYYLAEKLVDVEEVFHQWRFRHMKTVERVIGYKQGTGGSAGVSYLQKALQLKFFPELWSVRTSI